MTRFVFFIYKKNPVVKFAFCAHNKFISGQQNLPVLYTCIAHAIADHNCI